MSLDINHHCPACGKKGNRRCVKLRHIIECDIHRGRFYSKFSDCVSCAQARAREQRAMKEDEDDQSTLTDGEGKQGQKTEKKGKVKRPKEKSMKQLRRDKQQARTSSTS